jgi:hypothetical protein
MISPSSSCGRSFPATFTENPTLPQASHPAVCYRPSSPTAQHPQPETSAPPPSRKTRQPAPARSLRNGNGLADTRPFRTLNVLVEGRRCAATTPHRQVRWQLAQIRRHAANFGGKRQRHPRRTRHPPRQFVCQKKYRINDTLLKLTIRYFRGRMGVWCTRTRRTGVSLRS